MNMLCLLQGLLEEESFGSYVLVEKEDVLDAIGTFVAAYLATLPQAQNMKPADLQQALTSTFKVWHAAAPDPVQPHFWCFDAAHSTCL